MTDEKDAAHRRKIDADLYDGFEQLDTDQSKAPTLKLPLSDLEQLADTERDPVNTVPSGPPDFDDEH